MPSFTPLRYPGGKGRFSDYIASIIELNNLHGDHYIEPFAGGAGVALTLLFNEYVKKIHINDIDMNIYAFWHSVLKKTDELCRLINDTPITVEEWQRQKAIITSKKTTLLKRGFATFFLNRTNRSGILNGGIIGGILQKGEWKIDARYNKEELIERIQRIALFSDRIVLYCVDACEFLQTVVPSIKSSALIYLDPPYYVKGKGLYKNHYKHEDHQLLAKAVASIKRHKWLVSYDNVPEIKNLYKKYKQEEFALNYSAREHFKGTEVMIFQEKLVTPPKIIMGKKTA